MQKQRTMKALLFPIGLYAGLLILAACASPASQQGGQGDLTGPAWGLSTLMEKELVPGSSITAQFTPDGKVSGSAGCNRYSGAYTVSGSSLKIASPLASTMMACAPEVMDQETAYLKALGEVKTFTVVGDQLTLKDANSKDILAYKAQSQDLAGTSWEATGYNNGKGAVTSVLSGTSLTAEFGKDGNLSGNSGCNTYSGPYKATGNGIKIGPLVSTRKACGDPAGVMDQEAQYLAALETAATYKIEGATLELRTKDGALAVDYASPQAAAPDSANAIQGVVWQWTTLTDQSKGETTTVPNPEKYTITFNADGTLEGKADCNTFSGAYSQENGLTIKLGASTMAFCGEASLDQQYVTLLGSVAAGGPDGAGGLALETAGGEQRMLFENGGEATK